MAIIHTHQQMHTIYMKSSIIHTHKLCYMFHW